MKQAAGVTRRVLDVIWMLKEWGSEGRGRLYGDVQKHVKTLLLEAAKQKQFTSSLSELNPFSLFLESI